MLDPHLPYLDNGSNPLLWQALPEVRKSRPIANFQRVFRADETVFATSTGPLPYSEAQSGGNSHEGWFICCRAWILINEKRWFSDWM